MIVTDRDREFVRDLAFSHVLSRDQVIRLGYFSSVTRANTRLRELRGIGLVRRLNSAFHQQSLYVAGPKAKYATSPQVARLLAGRTESPRFLQHALTVTNIRLAMWDRGAHGWRFEQQLKRKFEYAGRTHEVRPDGLTYTDDGLLVIEADMGQVAMKKVQDKLRAYSLFLESLECVRLWDTHGFSILTVTPYPDRAKAMRKHSRDFDNLTHAVRTYDDLGIDCPTTWS